MKRILLLLVVLGAGCSLFAQTANRGLTAQSLTETGTTTGTPMPEWVPDPSAGHYDCPDGWTAYMKSEPEKYSGLIIANPAIYVNPPTDKKGHVLGTKPPAPMCIKDAR